MKINNKKNDSNSSGYIGTFMAIGPDSQIIVISGKSSPGCRCLDVYSCEGTYERSITVTTVDKCKYLC